MMSSQQRAGLGLSDFRSGKSKAAKLPVPGVTFSTIIFAVGRNPYLGTLQLKKCSKIFKPQGPAWLGLPCPPLGAWVESSRCEEDRADEQADTDAAVTPVTGLLWWPGWLVVCPSCGSPLTRTTIRGRCLLGGPIRADIPLRCISMVCMYFYIRNPSVFYPLTP